MKFFITMTPPTATAQERRVTMIKGRPVFYDPPRIRQVKADLTAHLTTYTPESPMEGPLSLRTVWYFPKGKSHKDGEWRVSRPDTDNLQKLLKDTMTKAGFWKDDAQVCKEQVEKKWSDDPTGIFIQIEELNS